MWYRLIEVFIVAFGLLVVPRAAEAQPVAKVPQIGFLCSAPLAPVHPSWKHSGKSA